MKLIKYFLLFISIFQIESCSVNTQEEKKQLFMQFVGKWKLAYAHFPSDSSTINSAKIILQEDSLFYSTTSIFWRRDSLKNQPINGKWSVSDNGFAIGGTSLSLTLKFDSLEDGWDLKGGRQDSMMYWSTVLQGRLYSWKLEE